MANNPSTTPPVAEAETIPRLLMRNATEHGDDIAMREKDRGIWVETTWSTYAEEVLRCSAGLKALGVGQ